MIEIIELTVSPDRVEDRAYIESQILQLSAYPEKRIFDKTLLRKSLDARQKIVYHLRYELYIDEPKPIEPSHQSKFRNVEQSQSVVHIIGAGPAGYFAALKALQKGIKPILIERGKDVKERRRDLKAIQQEGIVNSDSNYCFGEGGAGTYSDGKLYTRSHKRGPIREVLEVLVEHGAKESILYDAHPHIGSNVLPKIITAIRESILSNGGEIHFNSKMTDFVISNGRVSTIIINGDSEIPVESLIIATGHSARDIYHLFDRKKLKIEAKDFALGVRIEHPQSEIDQLQYKMTSRGDLPPSSYRLNHKIKEIGVYSFCMCPGGLIVPAATAPGEIVLNGMSLSRRDTKYANAGIVTEIRASELTDQTDIDPLVTLRFQKKLEQKFFNQGSGDQAAPSQLVNDFLLNKLSSHTLPSSYIPGLYSAPLHELFPEAITERLQLGLRAFEKKKRGFISSNAQILAIESRTSSPVRIPREKDFQHPEVEGLYPCGEGAGYAGGIMSAALDGMRIIEAISEKQNR